jgi:DNA-3-methyladenine glycosylase I
MMIEIKNARKEQSPDIARLIMTAMTDDCSLHFCGEGYGLEDFRGMMTMLVEREDSQYSYRNTLVAMDGDRLVGIAVSYDGGRLHELRQAFVEAAKIRIGKYHSGMDDETQAGELYLDSLAVLPDYRRQGIARRLLKATKEKADRMGLPCVGLLVDKGNPAGEALYVSVGFRYVNDNLWGGHPMKHLTSSNSSALGRADASIALHSLNWCLG